ncbi:PdaC/SigV domain-containing protein, partial [Clostridium tyrobutyricum]
MIYFSYPDNFKNNMKYRSENLKEGIKLEEQILEPDKFKISYPVVDNTKNKENISNINNAIINEVGELFKSQALVDGVVDFNQILGDYEVTLNESGILSILFSMYIYVNRAAHGYTKYSS